MTKIFSSFGDASILAFAASAAALGIGIKATADRGESVRGWTEPTKYGCSGNNRRCNVVKDRARAKVAKRSRQAQRRLKK